jgi:DNA-directed RNA polymerase specialized sigma subunit
MEPGPDRVALISAHLDLAHDEARKLRGRSRTEDLEQEAILALCEAAAIFDQPSHPGVPFAAFARMRIRWHLYEFLRRDHVIQVSARLANAMRKCRNAEEVLIAANGSAPIDEIARLAGVSIRTAQAAMACRPSTCPIEAFALAIAQ